VCYQSLDVTGFPILVLCAPLFSFKCPLSNCLHGHISLLLVSDNPSSFFFVGVGFGVGLHACRSGAHYLSHISSSFYLDHFANGVLRTFCPGWPTIVVLQTIASQVARMCVTFASCFVFFYFCGTGI
jgi:hypothetical protein